MENENDAVRAYVQRKWARRFDWATLAVLAIVIIYIFGDMHLKGSSLKINVDTWPTLVWIVCVELYFRVPKYWQRPTPGQRITSRFSDLGGG